MPEIKAFCGLRYNRDKIKDLRKVYAPPYDIISPDQQKQLYRECPYNMVRLELGFTRASDNQKNNRYTRAADYLKRWIRQGILLKDSQSCLYIYVQHYREGSRPFKRLGLLTAMKINQRAVFRHEKTLSKPKIDRLNLLKKVRTNLSPIFGLVEDTGGRIQALLKIAAARKADVDVTLDGVRHQLFAEYRPQIVKPIVEMMRRQPMHIADGHHRFDVACQYKRLMERRYPGVKQAPWQYVLTYLTDCTHNPFSIYPTHRLIRGIPVDAVKRILVTQGTLRPMPSLKATLHVLKDCRDRLKSRAYHFGFYTKADGFMILELDPKKNRIDASHPVGGLDVFVLHRHVLEPLFGIRAAHRSDKINFTRSAKEAADEVRGGLYQMAVFLRPTSLKEMLTVSRRGLRMPQKSTYFYPKLLSGLVLAPLESQ